jgi:hypothetical protein
MVVTSERIRWDEQVDRLGNATDCFREWRKVIFIVAPCILKSIVHSPKNAQFINLVKSFKFTLKYTIISLLRVSVFNDHNQGALSVPNWSYIYVKTLGKITSFYKLGDVAACRRAACVLCAVHCTQNSHAALRHAATSPNLYNDVILPSVLT